MFDDICRCEGVLNEFRHYLLAGNEVGHGNVRDSHDLPGDGIGDGRNPIDNDKRVADEGSFNRSGAAGNDRSAGMEQRSTSIFNEPDEQALAVLLDQALDHLSLRRIEGWREGDDELERGGRLVGESFRGGENFREVVANFLGAAAGEEADPGG